MQAEIIKKVSMSPELLEKETVIIRCKDCKHYSEPSYGYSIGECLIKSGYFPVLEEWFCADGKRKE